MVRPGSASLLAPRGKGSGGLPRPSPDRRLELLPVAQGRVAAADPTAFEPGGPDPGALPLHPPGESRSSHFG
jgi:hypothetical protein